MPGRRVGKRNASGASTSSRTSSRRSTSQPPPSTPATDKSAKKPEKNRVISPRSDLANEMKRNFSIGKEGEEGDIPMDGTVTPSTSQLKKLKVDDDVKMDDEDLSELEEKLSKRSLVENQESYLLQKFNSLPNGTMLVVGQGDTGQLGCGEDIMERKKPYPVKALEDKFMKIIACGGMHTACIDENHTIYTWGCNDEGALGRTCATDEDEMEPAVVNLPEDAGKAVSLTCGDSHVAVLDDAGQVYVWGNFRDGSGVLGLMQGKTKQVSPVKLQLNEFVVKISSGADHLAILANSGVAYTFGSGGTGQLGRGGRYFSDRGGRRGAAFVLKPAPVRFQTRKNNRLSMNDTASSSQAFTPRQGILTPSQSKNKCLVDDLFCSGLSTFVVSGGKVYTFGLNNYRQLGHGDTDNKFAPTCSEDYSKYQFKHICGGEHHVIALDNEHNVYAIGRGQDGRCGVVNPERAEKEEKHFDEITVLTKLNLPNTEENHVTEISSNGGVGYCCMSDGTGYSWGFGTNLQLTSGEEDDIYEPQMLQGGRIKDKQILSVSVGGQHGAFLVNLSDKEQPADKKE